MKRGYISAQKLDTDRVIVLPLSISLKTKAIMSLFGVSGTGKYFPSCWKSTQSWSKSRCALGSLGCVFSLKIMWGYISA